jgi:hypothetical protein
MKKQNGILAGIAAAAIIGGLARVESREPAKRS